MSRATMKTKFCYHGSFRTSRKAEKVLEKLVKKNSDKTFSIFTRSWKGKDKRRFMVRSVVRQGRK